MNNADIFALECYAAMAPVVAMLVWAWWKDVTESDAKQQEALNASDIGSESGSTRPLERDEGGSQQ